MIFSQGFVGVAFFLFFFLISFFRSWRCRTTPEVVATCVLLFFGLQMFVYDTLGHAAVRDHDGDRAWPGGSRAARRTPRTTWSESRR